MDLILNVKNNKNVSKHFILNEGINENLHCVVNINLWSDVSILLNTLLFHSTLNLNFGHISKYYITYGKISILRMINNAHIQY